MNMPFNLPQTKCPDKMHMEHIRAKFTSEDCSSISSDKDDHLEKDDFCVERQ